MTDPAVVREELDLILAKEITSFIDMGSDMVKATYNLATIACIYIIVEREKEIEAFKDAPPERYTIATLLDELVDIGLERDEFLRKAVDAVILRGYAITDEKGELRAELSAYTMTGFLDNMFPGMPGMNLIAFVLQMNEEVNSGRKGLEEAKAAFAQTLKQRGVRVSREKAVKKPREAAPVKQDFALTRKVTAKLKKNNLDRLAKLVKNKKKSHEPRTKLKVRDVFDKGPSIDEIDRRKQELENAEKALKEAEQRAKIAAETQEQAREAKIALKDAEEKAVKLEKRVKELKNIEDRAIEAEKKERQLKTREREMAAREAELKAMEERLKEQEQERARLEEKALEEQKRKEEEKKNQVEDEKDIEARIAALETDLAMPCPLCGKGRVNENKTGKGKEYFSCDNEECRFVSWDKPYHFSCPLCKNSYLIESTLPKGDKGLKCPRASCSYTQDNLMDPAINMAAASRPGSAGKKKVRRVVRRKKRR